MSIFFLKKLGWGGLALIIQEHVNGQDADPFIHYPSKFGIDTKILVAIS
jgi:hypothetical protein